MSNTLPIALTRLAEHISTVMTTMLHVGSRFDGWSHALFSHQVAPPSHHIKYHLWSSVGFQCRKLYSRNANDIWTIILTRGGGGGGGDLVSIMPVCVCPKVKEMGSFLASRE